MLALIPCYVYLPAMRFHIILFTLLVQQKYLFFSQNDAASCLSPNQIEEDLFFQMLMEDEKIDDATLVDEPDQYLLSRQLSNQVLLDHKTCFRPALQCG